MVAFSPPKKMRWCAAVGHDSTIGPSHSMESSSRNGTIGLPSSSVNFICHGTRLCRSVKAFGVPLARERRASGFGPGTALTMRIGCVPAGQVRAELDRHRLVLRRFDVLLEEQSADAAGIETQPRRAAACGPQAAELDAHEVLARRS